MDLRLFHSDPGARQSCESPARRLDLAQWFTPARAASCIVDLYFSNLSSSDLVVEPSCGAGAFLRAIPEHVPAIGVEIDPMIAAIAARDTGRTIITGDFATVPLPEGVTAVIGNPPFDLNTVERFLARIWRLLPEGGRAGLVLSAHSFQTHKRVNHWMDRWSLAVDLIPRNIFPGLRLPLVFATFSKARTRTVVGFALYREAAAVSRLSAPAREVLENGRPNRSVWRALVEETLRTLGGRASLADIYNYIEPRRPTETAWWREKVRQQLQQFFLHCGPGEYALAS